MWIDRPDKPGKYKVRWTGIDDANWVAEVIKNKRGFTVKMLAPFNHSMPLSNIDDEVEWELITE